MTVDPHARTGFADGAAYDSARPGYPPAAVTAAAVAPTATVVDLAAGTGKLTRVLRSSFPRVVAVEPSRSMRRALGPSIAGTAEAIPLCDNRIDAVFVAQAFHWFDAEAATVEIARVLRPGGTLAALANHERWAGSAWLPALRELLTPIRSAAHFPAGGGRWEAAVAESGLFEPWRRNTVAHTHHLNRAGFVTLIGSYSWIANLPDHRRTRVLGEVARRVPDRVDLGYETEVLVTARRPARSPAPSRTARSPAPGRPAPGRTPSPDPHPDSGRKSSADPETECG